MDSFPQSVLFFHVYSQEPNHIGLPMIADNTIMVGSRDDLLSFIVWNSIDRFVLGALFMLLGLMSFDLYMHRWHRRVQHYITFGIFTFSIGLAFWASAELTQFIIGSPFVRFTIAGIGLYFFPVGLFSFYEQIVEYRHEMILRRIWQFFLIYGIILFTLQLTGVVGSGLFFYLIWGIVLIGSIVVGLGYGIWGATTGGMSSRVFNIGFIVIILFIGHDILFLLDIIPYYHWLSPWGVLFFVLAITHIIERREAEGQEKLELYSRELQAYSETLEHKVMDRTRVLEAQKDELETVLETLRATQNQLVMKEKLASLGQVVAGVAHEINNPMGAIQSASDVSRRAVDRITSILRRYDLLSLSDSDRSRLDRAMSALADNNEVIDRAGHRVGRILKGLKEFAQLDEAVFQRDVDIHNGLDNTLLLLEHKLGTRIRIRRNYQKLPRIACYPSRLNQVFMNVLINAIEAIDESGEIGVATYSTDEHVVIVISDTGRGIHPDQIKNVFDPGYTTKGRGVGTGLGLATSYTIVQHHGGVLEVSSTPGEGTHVHIELPLWTDPQSVSEPSE
jgi:signal transduction histidine kinase